MGRRAGHGYLKALLDSEHLFSDRRVMGEKEEVELAELVGLDPLPTV